MFPLEETAQVTWYQDLPADPAVPVGLILKSSQGPINDDIDSETTGEIGESGGLIIYVLNCDAG